MDLLLTHGYFLREDPKELAVMKPYAPLGILYLSSHLRKKGFEVEIFDTTFRARADLLAIARDRSSFGGGHLRKSYDAPDRPGVDRMRAGRRVDRHSGRPGTLHLCPGISGGRRSCHRAGRGRDNHGGTAPCIASRSRRARSSASTASSSGARMVRLHTLRRVL